MTELYGVADFAASKYHGAYVAHAKSEVKTFTIAAGATGAAVAAVDLGANFDLIWVTCGDCSHIQAATSLTAQVAIAEGATVAALYEQDDPSTAWSNGALPTSGTLAFVLTHAAGARYVRLVLSAAASGGTVVFSIVGLHRTG